MKNIKEWLFRNALIGVFILIQIISIVWTGVYFNKNTKYYSSIVSSYDADCIINEKSREGYILLSRNPCCDGEPNESYSNGCMVSISMVKFKK